MCVYAGEGAFSANVKPKNHERRLANVFTYTCKNKIKRHISSRKTFGNMW